MSSRSSRLAALALGVRNAWLMIGVSLALLVALEAGCRLVGWCRDLERRVADGAAPVAKREAEVYDGVSWADDYWREHNESAHCRWRSYVYWRRKPYGGRWINVDDNGIRRTWDRSETGPGPRTRVFMFGGSTMWGTGARDDYTIPSCAARRLAEQGVDAEVTNFGESGYVSKQSLLVLMGELEKGNVPDLVVFYDGVNDTFAAYQTGQAGIPQNESHRREEFNRGRDETTATADVARWFFPGLLRMADAARRRLPGRSAGPDAVAAEADQGVSPDGGPSQEDRNGRCRPEDVVRRYRSVVDTVEILAKAHGFSVLFYWQPTVLQKRCQTAFEQRSAEKQPDYGLFLRATYDGVEHDAGLAARSSFRNLSGVFFEETQPVFIDDCHLGEAGNDVIAQRMVVDIRRELASRPSARWSENARRPDPNAPRPR